MRWTVPAYSTGVRLYEKVGNGAWAYVAFYGRSTTSKTYTGKAPGTYQYRTKQCTSTGGERTCWISASAGPVSVTVTAPGRVPAAPARPVVTAGNGSLTVSWVAPASNGSAITDYDMHYRVSGGTVWHNHVLRGTATRTTITGLTNGATYQLQVRAENAAGESPFSATATGTPTAGRVPDAPARPTVTAGNGSLTVSWVAPASNGSAITDYDMHYRVWGGTVWHNHVLRGTATRTTITGLTNGMTYQLQVRAENSAGESPFSATATGTLVSRGAITVSPSTSTDGSYTVRWTVPAYSTGVRLYEQVGSGAWAYVAFYGRNDTSKAYTGKAPGTYRYRTRQCTSTGGERTCWDSTSAGPVSVTVQLPRPTVSISWVPATVDYGETATRIWDSTHATACTINGRPHATSGRWVAENRTAGTTNRLVCTGPGGTLRDRDGDTDGTSAASDSEHQLGAGDGGSRGGFDADMGFGACDGLHDKRQPTPSEWQLGRGAPHGRQDQPAGVYGAGGDLGGGGSDADGVVGDCHGTGGASADSDLAG